MTKNKNILLFAILVVLSSCSKSIIVKPNHLNFGGITLYPNQTYDIIYAEHDVGGVLLNFGKYNYRGDTLVLELDKSEYLRKLTEPIATECEVNGIQLNFKEYPSPYDNTSSMAMYWFNLSVIGISNHGDTINIWKTNSMGNKTNLSQIKLTEQQLRGIEQIWVEIYDTPTTNPIHLPLEYKCLDITVPIINVIGSQVWTKRIMWGMDEFVIKESKRNYQVDAIQRQSKFKIKKESNNVHDDHGG